MVRDGVQEALVELRKELPDIAVEFDRVTGTAKWIASSTGFLAQGREGADAAAVVRDYVDHHRTLLGHGPEALAGAAVTRDDVTRHNGMHTLVWQQRFEDLTVFGALFKATLTRDGSLVNVGSQLVPDMAAAAARGTPDYRELLAVPTVSAAKAVAVAGREMGDRVTENSVRALGPPAEGPEKKQAFKAALLTEASARLLWVPLSAEAMRPAWEVVTVSKARGEMYRVLVDAGKAEVLVRQSLTEYMSDASYRVFTGESPTPFLPTHTSVSTLKPAAGSRSLIVTPAFNTTASPNGWIEDGVNETRGNNVEAHTDRDGDNNPDLPRPQGSPARVFDPPLNLAQDPVNYRDAAVVQLFYYCNMIHDRFYELGFTESAGNFQVNNFGRGGLGNDPVLADAQDNAQNGSRNNANFQTPDDGSPGRMQMYLWTSPNPDRDGDFDGLIVVHEYAHGLTNRLVGGGAGITDWHSRGMGEGWSDFYGLALLTPASADPQAAYAKAGYSTYQLSRLGEANHYFGIRRYPYSVDTTMNPLRFGDIDLSIDRAYPEVPLNPNTTNVNTPSVHREGEVWCGMLWDMRANLIARYGAAPGNDLALRLVTDGLKLSPANPTFVQARDAILQADLVNSGGLNRGEIWTAFAKRKMGSGAAAPPGGNLYTIGAVESGTVPDALEVSNLDGWNFNLDPGGTTSTTLTLRNTGSSSLSWSATPGAAWLQASPSGGSLAAGATVTLTVQANAAGLAPGRQSTMLVLRNEGSAFNQPVGARLNLAPPAVARFNLETDPGWARSGEWAYGTPQGGGGAAAGGAGNPDPSVAATGTKVLGVNLSGNHSVAVTGPDYLMLGPVNLSAVRNTRLRFRRWLNMQPLTFANATIEVSTDGTTWRSLFATGYSGAADDAWRRMEYEIGPVADQQATVYVRWGHETLTSPTAYSGWNLDDIEILGEPVGAALSLSFADSVNENAGLLTATLSISTAQASPLTVSLASSDTSAATVPASVTIPATLTSVTFNLQPVNDADVDGNQLTTITATAPGIAPAVRDLAVLDDESSTLVLTAPTIVTEGSSNVQASVRLTTPSSLDQVVTLQSDNTALTVTASVLIPANSTAPVTVQLDAPDNALSEGPKTVQITATIEGWLNASSTVTVADDESPRLTLTGPATAAEGDTPRTLTVARNAALGSDLTVNLASNNTGKVTVPATVVIPAGQQSATFSAAIVDNDLRDGSQAVSVTVSATDSQGAALDLTVSDNDANSYTFAPIASPQRRNNAFAVTLTARDVNGEIIATPASSVTLSGTAASGTVAFSPTALGTFSNGVASVSPTFTAAATDIVLTATDSFGRTGQSNAFDVVPVALDHFDWSGLPTSGTVNALLNATVTAKDDTDTVATGFNGSASLRAHVLYYDRTIGSPINSSPTTSLVFNTTAQDSRATLLYTAEELGGLPGWLGAISFKSANVGPNMSSFTIRMKLTPRTTLNGAVWEPDGWTTVYTAPTSQSGGIPNFAFTKPFYFDGASSLLLDISFDNSTTGTATTLRYTASSNNRVMSGTSASAHGNPLNWSTATGPATQLSTELPAMDVYFARDLGLLPASPASFASGVWSGQVMIPAPGSTKRDLGDSPVAKSAWMLASEASGAMGFSPRISVTTATTLPPSSSETIFSDDFESGTTLGASWSTAGSFPILGAPASAPRAAISSANTPRGSQHLVLDSSVNLTGFQGVLSAAELTVNLAGRSNVALEYWAKFMSGEVPSIPPGPQPFTSSEGIFDGIAISADGTNWYLAAPTIYTEPASNSFSLPTSYTAMRRVALDPILQRYGLSYNSTFRIKFLCATNRSAPGGGIAIDDVVIKANTAAAPALELPAQFPEGGTQAITVRLPSAPAGNVTVNLVSSAPARLTVPATVTVPAGQTTATASIAAPDNGFLDSGAGFGAYVTVTASGYPTSYANTFITDNETGVLSLNLPAQITEDISLPSDRGTVSITPAPAEDTTIALAVSNPNDASILGLVGGFWTENAVTVEGGTGTGFVKIIAINDTRIDGQQAVTVTASAPGLTSGSTTVLVNDNEERKFSLNLPSLIAEGGAPGAASVIIPGTLTAPLTVNLTSSDPSNLTVPATVTIGVGATATGFTVTSVNDTTDDGDLAVFITASAATFTSATGPVTVRDNDPSYFEFANIGDQAQGFAFPVTISARSSGNDLVTGYTSAAALSASSGGSTLAVAPANTTAFTSGVWTGNVTVNESGSAVKLSASHGATGSFGASNSFAVSGPDTTAPIVSARPAEVREASSASGAMVTFGASTVTDNVGVASVEYVPASGSVFPLGNTVITVTARDAAGNTGTGSFLVNARDTTAPALTLPSNVTVSAANAGGATVTYPAATAADAVSASPVIGYSQASGTVFPIGTTTVTVTATDGAGNVGTGTFTVTVRDTGPPVVSSRPAEVREATGPTGAVVTFGASTVTDNVGVTSVEYVPASGSVFPLGNSMVTVTARDAAGNTGTDTFTVTVRDTIAPVITSAPAQRVAATSGLGGLGLVPDLTALVAASDAVGVVSVTQTPLAGASRPAGSYPVTVSVADAAGNSAATSVTVVMADPVVITGQPQGVAVNPGEPVLLSVTADGTGPLAYQWRKGGVDLVGATQAVYSIVGAAEGDEGSYSVVVSNATGSAASSVAAVSVNDPVQITVQPSDVFVNPGGKAVLSVKATGPGPLTYQWRKDGAAVQGRDSAIWAIAEAKESDEGTYEVVVTNPLGAVTSVPVQVRLNRGVTIQTHPAPQVLRPGVALVLAVVASGTGPLEYQWRRGGVTLENAAGSEFRIESASESDSGVYDVVVKNVAGQVTSQGASVVVTPGGALTFSLGTIQRLKPMSELMIPIGVRREGDVTGAAAVQVALRTSTLDAGLFAIRRGVLNWAAGETGEKTAHVVINPGAALDSEGETMELELESPVGGGLGERRTMLIQLRPLQPGTLMFAASMVEKIKPASGELAFEVAVARSPGATGAVSVDAVVAGGTAAAADYTIAKPVRLLWEDGDVADKTFPVVYRGSVPAAGRTIVLKLQGATDGALVGGLDTMTLAIRSATVPGTLGFAEAAYLAAAPEGQDRLVPVVVRRTFGAKGAVTAQVAVADGSASGTDDYALPDSRTLIWEDGDLTDKVLNLRLKSTARFASAGETIVLKLQSQTGGAVLGAATTTITVLSSSALPKVVIASPAAGATVTGQGVVFRGEATDASGVARVEVGINGAPPIEATLLPTANGTRVRWMLAFVPEQGTNTVRVTAFDALGNRSVEAVRNFKFRYVRKDWAGVYDGLLSPETTVSDLTANHPKEPQMAAAFMETRGWGLVSVKVDATGAFSGRLTTGGEVTGFKGVLRKDGTALFRNNLPLLEVGKGRGSTRRTLGYVALRANASGQYPALVGELRGGKAAPPIYGRFTAGKAVFSGAKVLPKGMQRMPAEVLNPASENGRYTALFEPRLGEGGFMDGGLAANAFPQASGYALMTASKDGTVSLVGRLADGSTVSVSNRLSPQRTLPVYASLYGNRGLVAGTLSFGSAAPEQDAAAEAMIWFRPVGLAAPYKAGWPGGITLDLVGSKYVAPAKPSRAVPVPANPYSVFGPALPLNAVPGDAMPDALSMEVLFSGGGLAGPMGNRASLDIAHAVKPLGALTGVPAANGLRMAYKTQQGSFSGRFIHPVSGKAASFSGVAFQKQLRATGFFRGVPAAPGVEVQTGSVEITLP